MKGRILTDPSKKLKETKIFEKRMKSHHDSKGLIDKYVEKEQFTAEMFKELLDKKPDNRRKSIYVHTPYCDKICSFCNLNRKQLDGSLDEYAQYLADEFEKYGKTTYFKESKFEVIFFGGGTPTVYKPDQLEIILKAIQNNVKFTDEYEFTFETTLHNLSKHKLDVMMKYGVNRLSVGIQTFSERGRKFYNRTYGKEETIKKLKDLKKYFKGDVCVDIIYNFPGETIAEVIEDAKIVKEIGLSSASFYSLMIHEGSKLSKAMDKDNIIMEKGTKKDYLLYQHFVDEMLKENTYHILELTKIAKNNGDNYKYIKVRNSGGDTFPIGVGAGGGIQGVGVYRMSKDISFYSKTGDLSYRFSKLSGIMQFPELPKETLKKILTEKEYEYFVERMEFYKENELVTENENIYKLTKNGVYWGNNLSTDISSYILEKIFKK